MFLSQSGATAITSSLRDKVRRENLEVVALVKSFRRTNMHGVSGAGGHDSRRRGAGHAVAGSDVVRAEVARIEDLPHSPKNKVMVT
jgi:hypothetical protein